MATTTTTTNKPLNPRAQDLSPKGYNRANIFSGKALDFDGVNDKIDTSFAFSGSAASISFYLNWDNFPTNNVEFIQEGGVNDSMMVHLGGGAGVNGIRFSMSSSVVVDFTNAVQAGWNHYVLTTNNATAALYVNGRLVNSQNTAMGSASISVLGIGYRYNQTQYFINGKLSNHKIFNTALTPAQVSDLYLNPEKIVPDGVASSALKLWLPMMEGAGASAYDGSGNGNDGTINGATWTAGIGAPVAQTALVSWDKGVNLATHSEDFANGAWTKISTSVAFNTATAPNGTMTADSLNSTSSTEAIFQLAQANTIDFSVYAKAGTTTSLQLASSVSFNGRAADFNLSTGTAGAVYQIGTGDPSISGGTSSIESVGNGWYKCSINSLVLSASRAVTIANNNGNLSYIWGASLRPASAGDAYIKTNATAQTSAVLVPEGLTAGASIFGTDIITPRNAFALNLDGASWAQVGDNASLDITAAVTLEAWVYWDGAQISKGILGRYSNPDFSFLLYANSGTRVDAYFAQSGSTSYNSMTIGWRHIVGTFDGNTQILYVNGVNVASAVNPHTMSAGTKPIEIGRYDQNPALAWGNQLANPRIYNRALTAAEVLRNYNADKAKFGL